MATVAPVARAHPGPGIVVDARGRVFFVSTFTNLVMVADANGKVRPFVTDPRLQLPHHLVLGRDGSLYVASDYDGVIWRIGESGSLTEYFSSHVLEARRHVLVGQFGDPFTIDSAGVVFFALASAAGPTVVRIDHDTLVSAAANAQFTRLHYGALAWGPDGTLYASDGGRVWRIRADTARAITPRTTPLNMAVGMAIDSAGNVYVADYIERRIVRLAPDGTINTPPSLAAMRFAEPTGIALGNSGDLYVLGNPMGGLEVWHVTGNRMSRIYVRRSGAAYMRLALRGVGLLLVVGVAAAARRRWRRGSRHVHV